MALPLAFILYNVNFYIAANDVSDSEDGSIIDTSGYVNSSEVFV